MLIFNMEIHVNQIHIVNSMEWRAFSFRLTGGTISPRQKMVHWIQRNGYRIVSHCKWFLSLKMGIICFNWILKSQAFIHLFHLHLISLFLVKNCAKIFCCSLLCNYKFMICMHYITNNVMQIKQFWMWNKRKTFQPICD